MSQNLEKSFLLLVPLKVSPSASGNIKFSSFIPFKNTSISLSKGASKRGLRLLPALRTKRLHKLNLLDRFALMLGKVKLYFINENLCISIEGDTTMKNHIHQKPWQIHYFFCSICKLLARLRKDKVAFDSETSQSMYLYSQWICSLSLWFSIRWTLALGN